MRHHIGAIVFMPITTSGVAGKNLVRMGKIKNPPTADKKKSAGLLLNKASAEPNFRAQLATEARELTEIGNKFMIRHRETDKVPIQVSGHVDYLFQRMFALIRLLLNMSGREAVTANFKAADGDAELNW